MALDTYLQKQASQDMRRGFATVIVARQADRTAVVLGTPGIIGYYTLAAASLLLDSIPEEVQRALPRYPQVPAVRLGRLAVHQSYQGQHIGSLLLLDALRRACNTELAWAFFLVDAKDERAATFYKKFQFTRFVDAPLKLWMHRKQAAALTQNI